MEGGVPAWSQQTLHCTSCTSRTMHAVDIRCTNDKKLFDVLSQDEEIRKVNDAIERAEKQGPTGIRRRLLATSVRLSPTMAPGVHKVKDECMRKLGIETPLELFAYNSPQFNAACIKPEDGRLFIMFSSSLLEAFEDPEMRFVMGHELGHHLYHHHDIPVGHILSGAVRPNPKLALQLFTWSRYAEISADRAGAHCAQDFKAVGRALFRLASGLSDRVVRFDLQDFLNQIEDIQIESAQPGQGAPREDWFSTHPFSPLRVKALEFFHDSVLVSPKGISLSELELSVQRLMAIMEPNYLEGRTPSAEAMRRLLFAGAVMIAKTGDGISEQEIHRFEEFFGKDSFTSSLDIDRLIAEVPDRIEQVESKASTAQCMQVMHDLCLIAKADGEINEEERRKLKAMAGQLNIPSTFIDFSLASDVELD